MNESLAVLDVALYYIEQQAKTLPIDTMLLSRWYDINAIKGGSSNFKTRHWTIKKKYILNILF